MIAAFWTDIDTDPGGSLWYRTSTDSSILQLGTNIIRTTFPSFVTFSATWMMVVTWEEVASYGCSNTSIITCQQVKYMNGKINQLYDIIYKMYGGCPKII